MTPEHKITTLAEFMAVASPDNAERLVADFVAWVVLALAMREDPRVEMDESLFIWRDDDRTGEVSCFDIGDDRYEVAADGTVKKAS